MQTGWTGPDAEGPGLVTAGFLLSARAERGPVDALERARLAPDKPDGDPADADELAANLMARGYTPGMISQLTMKLADTMAELAGEEDKLEKSARRAERTRQMHERGQIDGFGVAARMQGTDEGDPRRAEQLRHRAGRLRQQIQETAELMAPPQSRQLDGVEAASRHAHQLFAEVTRAKMAQAAPVAPQQARRPFGGPGSVAARSEMQCVWCAAGGVDAENSALLHHDPELNVPVTTAADIPDDVLAAMRDYDHATRPAGGEAGRGERWPVSYGTSGEEISR